MDNIKDAINRILESREQRAERQRCLVELYKSSLISFTLNIPGFEKDHYIYRKVFEEGMNALKELLANSECTPLYIDANYKSTGSEGFICVDMDPVKLKELVIHLEDTHDLGRIFDIDVFDRLWTGISRKDLGYSERKCLLCDSTATVCRREAKHSLEELLLAINSKAKVFFENG